jgi:hypothetical protein
VTATKSTFLCRRPIVSKQKAKGTAAETAVVNYTRANGPWLVERRATTGAHDKGDLAGLPCAVEVKNCARMELAKWLEEATVEATNAQAEFGVVVHKRRGKGSPGDWYCTLSYADFLYVLRRAYP